MHGAAGAVVAVVAVVAVEGAGVFTAHPDSNKAPAIRVKVELNKPLAGVRVNMLWLILEMLLALSVIVGIMWWTLRTRTDHEIEEPSSTLQLNGDKGEEGENGESRQDKSSVQGPGHG